ncbi:hypothetical protein MTR67_039158 [Solanum verrucosum]|uniref:Uncharacterized protein n=1 Tax=Solanum verrucosum TaxID=315347 RepID=A0AAF0UGG1_SOLVR|nr:hypothetical protein MTR67_039158 [Solanum verrucosum]
MSISGGGVTVQNGSESSLVVEVKESKISDIASAKGCSGPLLNEERKLRCVGPGAAKPDDEANDAPSTQSQPPLSGHCVEEDLAAVQRRFGGTYASTSASVPPYTAFEVEMFCHQL